MPNREPVDINEVALLRSDRIALEESLHKADLMDGDNQLLRSSLLRFVERMDDVRAAAAFLPGEVPDVFEQVKQMSDRMTAFQEMAHEFLRATAVEIDDQAVYRASSEIAQKEMEAADILADSMKKQLINGAVSAIAALEADVDEQMAARLSGMTGIPAPELIACIRDMDLEIKEAGSDDPALDRIAQAKLEGIVEAIASVQSSIPETLLVKLCSSLDVDSTQAIARLKQRNVNVFGANL